MPLMNPLTSCIPSQMHTITNAHPHTPTSSLLHSHEEERNEVQKEYNRLPKRSELEHHRSELQRQCDELKDEISLVRDQAIVAI